MQMNFQKKRPLLVIDYKSMTVEEDIAMTVHKAETGQNILCYPSIRSTADIPQKIMTKVQELVSKGLVLMLIRRSKELSNSGQRAFDIILQKRRQD